MPEVLYGRQQVPVGAMWVSLRFALLLFCVAARGADYCGSLLPIEDLSSFSGSVTVPAGDGSFAYVSITVTHTWFPDIRLYLSDPNSRSAVMVHPGVSGYTVASLRLLRTQLWDALAGQTQSPVHISAHYF